MDLQIPEIAIDGLQLLLQMEDNRFNSVLDILSAVKPEMNWELLRTQITDEDAIKVFEAVRGLYSFRLIQEQTIEQITMDVIASMKEHDAFKSGIDSEKLKIRLGKILSLHKSLGITAKAKNVMTEQQNIYIESRILTDLRPVFCEEIEEEIPATVVIHNLRIEYSSDKGFNKKMVFAMDSKDLIKLEKTIERAKEKEKVLRKKCDIAGIKCLKDKK